MRCSTRDTAPIGLCNVAIGFQRYFAELVGATVRPTCSSTTSGLNHLTWERRALVDGADVLPGLLAEHGCRDSRTA